MFYLEFAFKKILKHPFRTSAFLLVTATLLVFASYYNFLQDKISDFSKIEASGPNFYALVNSVENAHWIARKIQEIPGVTSASVIEKEKIASVARRQLQELLKDNNVEGSTHDDVSESILNSSYYGIKVVCDKGTSERAVSLLREYMVRLAKGQENIIFGKISENSEQIKSHGVLAKMVKKELLPIGLIVVFIFWVISFFSFEAKVREASYIIEKFQRRKRVAFKTIFIFTLMAFIASTIPFLFNDSFAVMNFSLAALFIILCNFIELRKNTWVK